MKNKSELECMQKLVSNGWGVMHKGWPDFLAYKRSRLIAIEVKPYKKQALKNHQIDMMNLLQDAGIECFKYTPDGGLQRWSHIKSSEKRKRNRKIPNYNINYEDI